MSNLRTLKNKINTVKSIKKIFSVMQLIAASKMKKAQDSIMSSNNVLEKIKNLIARVNKDGNQNFLNFSQANQFSHLVLYVVFSSDRGLCGNYNTILAKKVNEIFSKNKNIKLIFIGNKLLTLLSKKYGDIIDKKNSARFDDLRKDESMTLKLLNNIFKLYQGGEISDCKIIYVHSKNAMSKNIKEVSLFDVDEFKDNNNLNSNVEQVNKSKYQENENGSEENNILYESDKSSVISHLINYYLRVKFFNFLKNAYFSELASRMIAMDNATRNSDEIQKNLVLNYNKKRQATITSDLIDIINGSENA